MIVGSETFNLDSNDSNINENLKNIIIKQSYLTK